MIQTIPDSDVRIGDVLVAPWGSRVALCEIVRVGDDLAWKCGDGFRRSSTYVGALLADGWELERDGVALDTKNRVAACSGTRRAEALAAARSLPSDLLLAIVRERMTEGA